MSCWGGSLPVHLCVTLDYHRFSVYKLSSSFHPLWNVYFLFLTDRLWSKLILSDKLQTKEKKQGFLLYTLPGKGLIFLSCSVVGDTSLSEVNVHIPWEFHLLFLVLPFSCPGNTAAQVGGHTACGWQSVHTLSPMLLFFPSESSLPLTFILVCKFPFAVGLPWPTGQVHLHSKMRLHLYRLRTPFLTKAKIKALWQQGSLLP